MATGSPAFQGNTSAIIFDLILHGTPASPLRFNREVPAELERIINKALEKDRRLRYQSALEMKTDIQRLKRDFESGKTLTHAAAAEKSLAVLYFDNLARSTEDDYFRDGMTEDIITELSKIRNLRLFPRAAVSMYRDKPVTAPQIGQELNATYIKELTNGVGSDSVLECVGTQESMMQAIKSTRPGGHVSYVGVPHGVALDGEQLFFSHVHLHGGPATVRRYLPELIKLVLNGKSNPGKEAQSSASSVRAHQNR